MFPPEGSLNALVISLIEDICIFFVSYIELKQPTEEWHQKSRSLHFIRIIFLLKGITLILCCFFSIIITRLISFILLQAVEKGRNGQQRWSSFIRKPCKDKASGLKKLCILFAIHCSILLQLQWRSIVIGRTRFLLFTEAVKSFMIINLRKLTWWLVESGYFHLPLSKGHLRF